MTEQTGNNKPNEAEGLAFPLSGNEKLIDSVRDWPTITRMSHSIQLEKLVELRDALEATGKALTPTDDEQEAITDEALWDFAGDLLDAWNIEDLNPPSLTEMFRDRFVARFRRFEVPEPSAEGPAFIAIMPPSPETSKRWYSMYCRVCGVEEMMAGTADDPRLLDRRDEHNRERHAEPQGEPSDAQVEAAGALLYGVSWGTEVADPDLVRAALRAATAVEARHDS